jgi:hypothetical protein
MAPMAGTPGAVEDRPTGRNVESLRHVLNPDDGVESR